ncbi:competence protein CoiA [Dolosicoccus paucivorans]|uniref:competence protein CoiA n=1 Tax=Dolosicoccus paucivorans TaxID=84521 RepID=UPI0008851BC1|nr:competence protein CoiA family protein [Dolosicoccus paucivorans]SDI21909.1 Competence protein CoiA-like family, contains a predicted nuclease domain [Dolosicoccus paucivorans]
MLYMAFTKDQRVVYAQEVLGKEGPFYCPKCKKEVIVKCSSKDVPFFSHVTKKRVALSESPKHKLAKEQLSHWFQDNQLHWGSEMYLKDTSQYPDVLVEYPLDSQQLWCIEFQHSRLSATDLYKRQLGYKKQSLKGLWLLDDETVNTTIPKWHFNFVQYNSHLGLYLVYYNVTSNELVLRYHLPIAWQSNKLTYQTMRLPLNQTTLTDLFNGFTKIQQREKTALKQPTETLKSRYALEGIKSTANYRRYLNTFYRLGHSLEDLPYWVWGFQPKSWVFKEPIWYTLGRLFFEATKQTFTSVYDHFIETEQINYELFPLLDGPWQRVIQEEIEQLMNGEFFNQQEFSES